MEEPRYKSRLGELQRRSQAAIEDRENQIRVLTELGFSADTAGDGGSGISGQSTTSRASEQVEAAEAGASLVEKTVFEKVRSLFPST